MEVGFLSNEEFQSLVLEELRGIRGDINYLKEGQTRLEHRLERVENRVESVENRLESVANRLVRVENKLDAVYEQTAILTEFRTETNMKLDKLMEDNRSIHEMAGMKSI